MNVLVRFSCALAASLVMAASAFSQDPRAAAPLSNRAPTQSLAVTTDTLRPSADTAGNPASDDKAKVAAANETAISDPLIRVLIAKGIITADEGRAAASGNAARSSATASPRCCATKA